MSQKGSAPSVGRQKLPKARAQELLVQDVGDETLVYDVASDKAHHLNTTSSIIWRNCDGKTSYLELAKKLECDLETEIESDFIWLAVEELRRADLLEESANEVVEGLTRRKVILKYGLTAAVAIPAVVSLVTPANAQVMGSCLPVESACDQNMGLPCCPGSVCQAAVGSPTAGVCQPASP